jgi:thioredoxin 1
MRWPASARHQTEVKFMALKHVNAAEFDTVIHSGDKVLVDFFATWCGPCKFIAPVLEELGEELAPGQQIVKLDIDENPQVANAYQVTAVPTMILFQDGREVNRLIGVRGEDEIAGLFA